MCTPGWRGRLKRKIETDENLDGTAAKRQALDPSTATEMKREQSPAQDAIIDPALLADHFAKHIRATFPSSSPIELDEKYLPTKAFLDTTAYKKERVVANLPEFLEQFSVGGKDALSTCHQKGMPHTLVVTSSGMRTADLSRALRVYQNEACKVAKLVAKHTKLRENIQYMRTTKIGIAVSTPFRFIQLMDSAALNTERLQRIVVDGSHRDEKRNTVFMLDQVFKPLVDLLNEDSIRSRYGASHEKVDVLVF